MTDPSDATGEEPANPPPQRTLVRPPRVLQVGKTYDPLPRREKTRSWLAFSLVALLTAVALSLIGLTAGKLLDPGATKDLVAGILSPLTALTGAALGFYFGGHHGPN